MRRLLLSIAICASITEAHAQPIVASSFDGAGSQILSPGTAIDGWTVTAPTWNAVYALASDYSESSVHFNAHSGNGALDLTGAGNAGSGVEIYRDVRTNVGRSYDISFFVGNATGNADGMQGNSSAYALPSSIELWIDGVSHGVFTNGDTSYGAVNWKPFNAAFVATGDETRVSFVNATPVGDNYAGLDDVEIAAVPEPMTWAMTILGFGAIGCAMRRKSPTRPLRTLPSPV